MVSDGSENEDGDVAPLINMAKRRYSMVLKAHNQVIRVSLSALKCFFYTVTIE
jgi:hypothetical protein